MLSALSNTPPLASNVERRGTGLSVGPTNWPKRQPQGPPKSLKATAASPRDSSGRSGSCRVHPSPKDVKRTLTSPGRSPGESDTDSDDDSLVSGLITPVTVPIKLIAQSSGHKASLVTLLDSECTRCLVNPALVEKLGVRLRPLKVPVTFCQLDGSIVGDSSDFHH